jgi:DNA-binding NarL/FixJ family response regulator
MITKVFSRWLPGNLKPAWAGGGPAPLQKFYEYLGRPLAQPFPGRDENNFSACRQEAQPADFDPSRSPLGAQPVPPAVAESEELATPPREGPITVAIVEDQGSVRENLAKLINGAPGFKCVAACVDAAEALRLIPRVKPEIVLMDINLPDGRDGIECTAELCELMPDLQIIMLTIEEDPNRVFESLKAGASGYLVKHASPEEILEALTEVHRGGAPMSSLIARKVVTTFRQRPPESVPDAVLSPRQEEILKLLSQGLRNKEIAESLGIGPGVVNNYIRRIYKKLHARSRAQAIAKYRAQSGQT